MNVSRAGAELLPFSYISPSSGKSADYGSLLVDKTPEPFLRILTFFSLPRQKKNLSRKRTSSKRFNALSRVDFGLGEYQEATNLNIGVESQSHEGGGGGERHSPI